MHNSCVIWGKLFHPRSSSQLRHSLSLSCRGADVSFPVFEMEKIKTPPFCIIGEMVTKDVFEMIVMPG